MASSCPSSQCTPLGARSSPFHRWGQTQDKSFAECGGGDSNPRAPLWAAVREPVSPHVNCVEWNVALASSKTHSGWGADPVEMEEGGWLSASPRRLGDICMFLPDILAEIVKPKAAGISRLPLLFS